MELVTLFRFVEVLLDAPGGATLSFLTDLPGNALAVRGSASIPATTGRHPYRMPLPGWCKGKLYQIKVVPAAGSTMALYELKVYARVLGPQASMWAWHRVPGLIETAPDWQPIKLPIEATSDAWQQVKLPIETTPDAWQQVKIPIEATGDAWNEMKLPVKETPVVPVWVDVQVDE